MVVTLRAPAHLSTAAISLSPPRVIKMFIADTEPPRCRRQACVRCWGASNATGWSETRRSAATGAPNADLGEPAMRAAANPTQMDPH